MTTTNQDIAALFERMAILLELEGANTFRVRAYQNAANLISNLSKSLSDMVAQGDDPSLLPGIGKDLSEKIKQIIKTGKLKQLQELEIRIPPVLLQLLKIQGLGPKRIRTLQKKLIIHSLDDLKQAALKGKIRELSGFGAKIEQQILKGIEYREENSKRILWADAEPIVQNLITYLKQTKSVKHVEAAGSFRRKKESIGDLDILAICRNSKPVIQHFIHYPEVGQVMAQGNTRSTVLLHNGLQVDLRVVAAKSYGAALHYFTGSQAHNIAIRKLALQKNLKVNEYGVYCANRYIAGKTEAEIFKQVGLPYIEPELRENSGEIEAAQKGMLPQLITIGNIRGDLHTHSQETDGALSLEELAQAAQTLGYEYLAITDHSQHMTIARGMDDKRLWQQIKAIDKLNARLNGIVLLKGIEVDILENGKLDLPDSILKELDFTIGSIHSKFNLPENKQTERILRAMDNPLFTILGHPTSRLLGTRAGYTVNMERIIQGAKQRGCFIELNAHPQRLDITDIHCKQAKAEGVLIAISSDAHSLKGLQCMRYGVQQAQRGWLEAKDVLNTRPLKILKQLFKR